MKNTENDDVYIENDDTSIWKPKHIKLFISHRDKHKINVEELANLLLDYGVDCFIAHKDIEPTEEWQVEIKKALSKTDVFLAYITDDFSDSAWTNQEVGFAIAQKTPIIALKMSKLAPPGFLAKEQALSGSGKNIYEIANGIIKIILKKFDNKHFVKTAIINCFVNSYNWYHTAELFELLKNIRQFTNDELDRLVKGYNENSQVFACRAITRDNVLFDFLQTKSNNAYEMKNRKIQKTEEALSIIDW